MEGREAPILGGVAPADLLLLASVAFFAASGFVRGFAAQVLTLAGLVGGTLVGAWVFPHLLPGGLDSPWVPLASLVGAAVGALVLGLSASVFAARARHAFATNRALAIGDRVGGLVAGGLLGLALAWLAGVLFLHQSGLGLRRAVQESAFVPALVRAVPPEPVLRALSRFDPLPLLPGLAPRTLPPPNDAVLASAAARRAAASVVKVEGTSCGLGVQGSGWVVRRGVVATNAHVVAGQTDTQVLAPEGEAVSATVAYVDATNDVALLRAPSLRAAPLRVDRTAPFPASVVLLGYPRDGPLAATAGTAGAPRGVLAPDAYGRRVRPRAVVPLRGRIQRGESGGPVVDRRGRVVAMIFGGTRSRQDGFGVPVELVLRGVHRAGGGAVPPGPCVG